MPYGTNAEMDAYWAAAGYSVASLSEAGKTAARTNASRFVDGLGYRETGAGTRVPLWPGKPLSASQDSDWPRSGAVDVYGNTVPKTVPTRIENATYEAAYFIASGGDVNRAVAPDQRIVREKVDVIETQYSDTQGSNGKPIDTRPVIPAVMEILAPLIGGGRYSVTMVVSE